MIVRIFFVLLLCMAAPITGAGAERHALIIGISDYSSAHIERLEGPAHDVVSMTRALIRQWQFKPAHVTTLMNEQATFSNIQAELRSLKGKLQSGDSLFFYFSGHGTSAFDPQNLWPMPYGTGAVVPFDAAFTAHGKLDKVVFSRSHIRPVFENLDQRGVTVLAVFDTCYSEHATRKLDEGSYRVVTGGSARQPGKTGLTHLPPAAYPYQNVYMIAAAGENQLALDLDYKVLDRFPSVDGMPHGALTDSLLRVLQGKISADSDGNGILTHHEFFNSTRLFMRTRGFLQDPKAYPDNNADSSNVSRKALFISGSRP